MAMFHAIINELCFCDNLNKINRFDVLATPSKVLQKEETIFLHISTAKMRKFLNDI